MAIDQHEWGGEIVIDRLCRKSLLLSQHVRNCSDISGIRKEKRTERLMTVAKPDSIYQT